MTAGQAAITEAGQVVSAYARWAPFYDLVFEAVMHAGRVAATAAASRVAGRDGRVIDIGVGTGLELPMFARGTRVVGIDLSEPMLRRAQARVARHGLTDVEGLLVMDATSLAFPDASFDAAVVPFTLTVVPEPRRVLDEIRRVVRPGGEIIIVSHFGAERGAMAMLEGWLGQRSAAIGWHPQFPFAIVGDWVAAQPDITLIERRKVSAMSLFTLVRLRRAD